MTIFLNELGMACALGSGNAQIADALFADAPLRGLSSTDACSPGRALTLGVVAAPLPDLSDQPTCWRGRNNALLLQALAPIRAQVQQAIESYGAHRVGIVLGTSTSGVGESEAAHRHWRHHGAWPGSFHYAQQEMGNGASFLARWLGTRGPAHVISTACSSSAKALASAARLIGCGLADAVIAGGADSLCRFTVAGFSALDSVSADPCNPFSRNRRGINIGEGAALFLVSARPGPVRLAGWGESSDAHHMSAPDPSGQGAAAAVRQALARAALRPDDIGYINLHGTATAHNDAMEANLVAREFAADTPASSTKPLTGHTLGAAGAIEAGLCWLTLAHNPHGRLPAHHWDGVQDPALPILRLPGRGETPDRPLTLVLSQSFAFGGSNAALVLGKA